MLAQAEMDSQQQLRPVQSLSGAWDQGRTWTRKKHHLMRRTHLLAPPQVQDRGGDGACPAAATRRRRDRCGDSPGAAHPGGAGRLPLASPVTLLHETRLSAMGEASSV